ncbi:MAG: 2TM domain-containing protein [Chlamydiia bacterium]
MKHVCKNDVMRNLLIYLVVNGGLWILWYFQGAMEPAVGMPWPAFISLFWGMGLLVKAARHYFPCSKGE